MAAEGGNSNPGGGVVSRLSLSPDSSEPGTTPKTPECTSIDCDFGAGNHTHGVSMGMTPTPPPSVKGPSLLAGLDACRIAESHPFAIGPLHFGAGRPNNIWSSRGGISAGNSIGRSGELSHIWTNRQTTPPRAAASQAIRDHAQDASYLRWASLESENARLEQQQTSASGHVQDDPLDAGHAFHQQQHHQHRARPFDDDTFDFLGSQIVQDLGVDVLRISPPNANLHPLRLPPQPSASHGFPPRQAAPGIPLMPLIQGPVRQPLPPPPPPSSGLADIQGSNTGIISTGFTPMHAVNEQARAACGLADAPGPRQISTRFSMRYHGMHTEANASAEHLTSEQNCALWLTNLPPDVTPRQLLSAIRKVGRIWCSFINYPDYQSHHTAAAKVVFFSPKATQQFLSDSWTKGLYIGTNRVRVSHNRIKSESKEDELATPKSRVLIITGRAEFVNEAYLTKYFKDRFIFQNDEVTELINAGGRAVLEWKFGSYRCQAQMGKMSLEKDRPYWLEKVEFGQDPCEVGDTYTSYGIAAERIQGRGL
ncbi:hypothetical protein ESCO_002025 [Escovopsis weberi]|uniref:Uncharacterized protein n=1 Tax=Escovopsis weberi TaxID=150374 RepID=A0A0N0RU38_ESCWE|nr:hypothetical protein ESCO_002025 [Escovopsis weberi]